MVTIRGVKIALYLMKIGHQKEEMLLAGEEIRFTVNTIVNGLIA